MNLHVTNYLMRDLLIQLIERKSKTQVQDAMDIRAFIVRPHTFPWKEGITRRKCCYRHSSSSNRDPCFGGKLQELFDRYPTASIDDRMEAVERVSSWLYRIGIARPWGEWIGHFIFVIVFFLMIGWLGMMAYSACSLVYSTTNNDIIDRCIRDTLDTCVTNHICFPCMSNQTCSQ